ncbi:three-helix bundle dimerization domain-containing protein [Mycolicibacterium llatzerense]|uniref:three-helix bundle dimerization domain-containing protein n=1 Tax=Mycolicibacterium llatzerense TaxID=280871 RepID=UPI00068B0CFC|nr:hypothetical protein [Mycolicibacterium llatzerense]
MDAPRTAFAVDELDAISRTLTARFPDIDPGEVRRVVDDTYRHIAAGARISAHLIPLTLHRAREVLAGSTAAR